MIWAAALELHPPTAHFVTYVSIADEPGTPAASYIHRVPHSSLSTLLFFVNHCQLFKSL